MANNITVPPTGSGTATPVVSTQDIGSEHHQRVISGRPKLISVTPTISTSIYAVKDAIGGLLTFANAARFSGGGGYILATSLVDKDQELAPIELILFDRTFTNSTDNAIFAPSDADMANWIANIPLAQYGDFSTNAGGWRECLIPYVCNGTDLFGQLVSRGTPTFSSTGDLTVRLHLSQE